MNPAVSFIMLSAFVLYTVGVWGEKIKGRLQWWHLILFSLGLICDSLGTGIMISYSEGTALSLHGISGYLAIILMINHALWALIVLLKKDEKMIIKFHRFSIFVWIIWLIPYTSPMLAHIIK